MPAATPLRYSTSTLWTACVLKNLDKFLLDHAAAEKKASGMAISMISHYPDRPELVSAMADLAIEELNHYKEVIKIIYSRGLQLGADEKDSYVLSFRDHMRKNSDEYFLDRLLIASIIEARGAERFQLIAEALGKNSLKFQIANEKEEHQQKLHSFYQAIADSEQRHYLLFLQLAELYFPKEIITKRYDELLDVEANIMTQLPIQAKLH